MWSYHRFGWNRSPNRIRSAACATRNHIDAQHDTFTYWITRKRIKIETRYLFLVVVDFLFYNFCISRFHRFRRDRSLNRIKKTKKPTKTRKVEPRRTLSANWQRSCLNVKYFLNWLRWPEYIHIRTFSSARCSTFPSIWLRSIRQMDWKSEFSRGVDSQRGTFWTLNIVETVWGMWKWWLSLSISLFFLVESPCRFRSHPPAKKKNTEIWIGSS